MWQFLWICYKINIWILAIIYLRNQYIIFIYNDIISYYIISYKKTLLLFNLLFLFAVLVAMNGRIAIFIVYLKYHISETIILDSSWDISKGYVLIFRENRIPAFHWSRLQYWKISDSFQVYTFPSNHSTVISFFFRTLSIASWNKMRFIFDMRKFDAMHKIFPFYCKYKNLA